MERAGNYSRQREAVLNALRSTTAHPSAEWVYGQLKEDFPRLSLATVYRNLRVLVRQGQAVSVGIIGGQERFDARVEPHAHLVCSRCGAVVDVFDSGYSQLALDRLSENAGCKISRAEVLFHGICPDCCGKTKS